MTETVTISDFFFFGLMMGFDENWNFCDVYKLFYGSCQRNEIRQGQIYISTQ